MAYTLQRFIKKKKVFIVKLRNLQKRCNLFKKNCLVFFFFVKICYGELLKLNDKKNEKHNYDV